MAEGLTVCVVAQPRARREPNSGKTERADNAGQLEGLLGHIGHVGPRSAQCEDCPNGVDENVAALQAMIVVAREEFPRPSEALLAALAVCGASQACVIVPRR